MYANVWSVYADQALVASISITGLAAFGRYIVRPVYKFAKRIDMTLSFVELQMKSDDGSTLRDQVDKVVERVNALETGKEAVSRAAKLSTQINTLSEKE